VSTCNGNSFGSESECLSVCATYPSIVDPTGEMNTIQCREAYATNASLSIGNVTQLCYYASAHGGGKCGTTCQVCNSVISHHFNQLCSLIDD
jgi:hypothetical protein